MVSRSEQALINAAFSYFRQTEWPPKPSKSDEWVHPYALLAQKVMDVCPDEPVKYTSLAGDLGNIAIHFGVGNDADRVRGRTDVTPQQVASHRNDLAKGKGRTLAPTLLAWLWRTHPAEAKGIFEACGFDYQSAIAQFEHSSEPASDTVLVAPQNRNKFDLSYLLANAKSRIILVAQNHWHLISQPEGSDTDFWPKIEAAIRRGVTVEIVAMHPYGPPAMTLGDEVPDAIQLWSLYMKAPAFRSHVDRCWKELDRFARLQEGLNASQGSASKMGSLSLYRAYFVPMSITVVDPLTADGMAVVSPRTANEVSGTRPEFVLRRKAHEQAFLYYWSFVENGLANQGWERV